MRDHVVVESEEISPREAEVLAASRSTCPTRRSPIACTSPCAPSRATSRRCCASSGSADRRALAGMAGPTARLPADTGRLTGIPVSRTTFVGRSRDVEVALERLAQARLVTLLGPGGVGKTRLAAVVAESAPRRIPGAAGRSSTWCRSARASSYRPWPCAGRHGTAAAVAGGRRHRTARRRPVTARARQLRAPPGGGRPVRGAGAVRVPGHRGPGHEPGAARADRGARRAGAAAAAGPRRRAAVPGPGAGRVARLRGRARRGHADLCPAGRHAAGDRAGRGPVARRWAPMACSRRWTSSCAC